MTNITILKQDTFNTRRMNVTVARHYNVLEEYLKILGDLKKDYSNSPHDKATREHLIVHQAKRRLNILVHKVKEKEKRHGIY